MKEGISIIVPLWGDTHTANAKSLAHDWADMRDGFNGVEMTFVEPYGEPMHLPPELYAEAGIRRTLFYPSETGWHLSRARNVGAVSAKCDKLVFHDADAKITEMWLASIAVRFQKYPCFGTYNAIYYEDIYATGGESGKVAGGGCGLSFAITRKLFEQVGQWYEFPGWGEEDVEYRNRISRVTGVSPKELKKRCIPFTIRHRWHPEADKSHVAKNQEISRA